MSIRPPTIWQINLDQFFRQPILPLSLANQSLKSSLRQFGVISIITLYFNAFSNSPRSGVGLAAGVEVCEFLLQTARHFLEVVYLVIK